MSTTAGEKRASNMPWTSPTMLILVALTVGWVGGALGALSADGSAVQGLFWWASSMGIVAGASLLAARAAKGGWEFGAAGFGVLAIAEVVIWSGGPHPEGAGVASFAGGTMFYWPALWMIAFADWSPMWNRVVTFVAGIVWAVYGFQWLLGHNPDPYGNIPAGAGYGLLSLAMIGWSLTVWKERTA